MLIFLFGPDTYRSRRKLASLKTRYLTEVDLTGFNLIELDATTATLSDIRNGVLTPALGARSRLTIIERLITSKPEKNQPAELIETLQKMPEHSLVIIWDEAVATVSRKNPLFKFLAKQKYAQEFLYQSGLALAQTYRQLAQDAGGAFEPLALTRLIALCGQDLWRANMEVRKLVAFCQVQPITVAVVVSLCQREFDESIFTLTDALANRRLPVALALLGQLRRCGHSELEILSAINWQFRILLLAKSELTQATTAGHSTQLVSRLRLHPYVAKKTLGQLPAWTLPELKAAYTQLLKIEAYHKTGRAHELWLDLFAANL